MRMVELCARAARRWDRALRGILPFPWSLFRIAARSRRALTQKDFIFKRL